MIKLHIPKIVERIHKLSTIDDSQRQYQMNELLNLPTRAMMQTIFNNADVITNFVGLIALLEPWIYLHANIKLIDNNHLPLVGEEKITLILTGDTLINYYYNNEKDKLNLENNRSNIFASNVSQNSFFEKYDKAFGQNGFEYKLNIKTTNSNRFDIIEKYCIESATEFFDLVAAGLDTIYSYYSDRKMIGLMFPMLSVKDQNINILYENEYLTRIKNLMASPHFSYSLNLFSSNDDVKRSASFTNIRESNINTIDSIDRETRDLPKQMDNLMFFPYIYYFNKIALKNVSKTSGLSQNFVTILTSKINSFLLKLSENFYQNLNNTISYLVSSSKNTLSPIYVKRTTEIDPSEDKYLAFYDEIVVPNNPTFKQDVNESVYIYGTIDGIKKDIIDVPKRRHFVVVDQSYAQSTRNGTHNQDLDIISLKLNNILAQTGLDMSFNLVKIDIEKYGSSDYGFIANSSWNLVEPHNIKIDTKKNLIKNLMEKLFDGRHYLPWNNDIRPDYSISKLLFLLKITNPDELIFLEKILTTNNLEQYLGYHTFYNINYQTNSFYNLIWIDHLTVKRYYDIEYLIKFIILMDNLKNRKNITDEQIYQLLCNFQKSYGWYCEEISSDKFFDAYTLFRNDLLNIVKELNLIDK